MENKEQIKELCEALGWFSIYSANPYMISFKEEQNNRRVNIYFTTMTVTIEDYEKQQHHYREVTLDQLEKLLQD